MLRFFRKRTPPFDHAKLAAGAIALLEMQMAGGLKANFETREGVNRRAIGYPYGFVGIYKVDVP